MSGRWALEWHYYRGFQNFRGHCACGHWKKISHQCTQALTLLDRSKAVQILRMSYSHWPTHFYAKEKTLLFVHQAKGKQVCFSLLFCTFFGHSPSLHDTSSMLHTDWDLGLTGITD